MGEYDGVRPQDDWGHRQDDDLSDYHPGMGAMVSMGYEPGASGFEAFDMGHTWAPGMPTGYPHGPFDDPQMGYEFGDEYDDPEAPPPPYFAPQTRPGWAAWQRPMVRRRFWR